MSDPLSVFKFVAASRGVGGDCLIVPMASKPKPALQSLSKIDALCDDAVSELINVKALGEEIGQLAHTTRSGAFRRIVVVSLGDDAELDVGKLRKAAAAAAAWLTKSKIAAATLWIDGLLGCNFEHAVAEWCAAMCVAGFSFKRFKKSENGAPASVKIALRSTQADHVQRSLAEAESHLLIADAINYSRSIAHLPPNVLTPTSLAAEARKLARDAKLACTVIDHKQAARLGMNGLLAVGMASEHKPCLIRLDYKRGPAGRRPVVLVGKSITFDTGGISIKPAAGMEAMKFDKCGGMTVLGVMRAIAALRLRINVVGLLAAAENTLSDEAYRPSDILKMMNGKFVEVTNTDAEGRLVLADALTYAQKNLKPDTLIDLATLTGGVVTALGSHCAGLMTSDDNLAAELEECGRRTFDRVWRLPLWDEYFDLIKGGDADFKNSAGKRHAHPIVGGIFLKQFVDKGVPWAHLDIAGVATTEDDKNATGWGVRLLVEYLRKQVSG